MRTFILILFMVLPAAAQEYLVLSSTNPAYADAVSRKLWQLHVPTAATDTNRVTQLYAGWVINTNDNRIALHLPDVDFKIHANANTNDLPDSLAASISPSEKAKLKTDISTMSGQAVRLKLFIPPSRKLGHFKTREELQQEGGWPL